MNAEEIDYVRSQSGWSDVILKNINSIDEAKIYLKAGLKEAMVGGRHALIRSDIDWSALNCRKEWLKAKLSDWDRWKDYNNADLIGEGTWRAGNMNSRHFPGRASRPRRPRPR